jgi:hypothetical protein
VIYGTAVVVYWVKVVPTEPLGRGVGNRVVTVLVKGDV